MRVSLASLPLPLLALLAACSSMPGSQVRRPASNDATSQVPENARWSAHANSFDVSKLQPDCRPIRLDPAPGVVPKSKVILVHGFTACPQQFYDWAQELTAHGHVVYLPLLPGHGRVAGEDGKDDIESVPGRNNPNGYEELAKTIVEIARGDSLPTAVGGLSVGGAVAFRAMSLEPSSFAKGIFFAPFFAIANVDKSVAIPVAGTHRIPESTARWAAGLAGATPIVQDTRSGWGPGCVEELRGGRNGVCDYYLHQIKAAQDFGMRTVASAKPFQSPVQFVGVEADGAASNLHIGKLFRSLQAGNPRGTRLCFYRKGANHSLFSRYDAPHEDKFWVSSLVNSSTRFVDEGEFFELDGRSTIERTFFLCRI
jgi:pimeloyl-ACP methyl ester carboxylesterase